VPAQPDLTCRINDVCFKQATFCEKHLCMCKPGYKVEKGTQNCVPATAELAELVARNATADEIELLVEHRDRSGRMAAQNAAIVAAALFGAAMLFFLASAWALRRRTSNVTAQPAGYEVLVG